MILIIGAAVLAAIIVILNGLFDPDDNGPNNIRGKR